MSKQIAKSLTAAASQLAAVAATLQQAAAALGAAPAPAAAPAAPQWTPEQKKKLIQFRGAFMALGDDEKTASQKAIAKLTGAAPKNSGASVAAPVDQPAKRKPGRPAGSGRAAAPAPAPVQKKKSIHMLTLEEVREGTGMTLAQFCKSLVEDHGLDRDSEEFARLRKQFLDLRAKLKAQVEEENDVAASGEDLVDGFVVDGGDDGDAGYDFDPQPAPKKGRARLAEDALDDTDAEFGF